MESPVTEPKSLKTPVEKDLNGPALRTFFRITEAWGLKAREEMVLLGSPPESTFFHWKRQKTGSLSRDVMERISYVLGIYKALQILFTQAERADAWIKRQNEAQQNGRAHDHTSELQSLMRISYAVFCLQKK